MKVKERIRQEIERLKHYAEESKMEWVNEGYNQNAFAEDCRISSFDKLLTFIDTLPDEPVSDDLEKAADDYIGEVVDTAGHPGWDWETHDIIEAYIAGANRHRNQKPADDKAFEEWIDDWWKHNKVNNPGSYDKGDEIQFDERGFKNFCRGIRNMYAEK